MSYLLSTMSFGLQPMRTSGPRAGPPKFKYRQHFQLAGKPEEPEGCHFNGQAGLGNPI